LKLDAEALQVLTLYYRQFVHAGANLSPADKTRLRQINKQDASLETAFQQKAGGCREGGSAGGRRQGATGRIERGRKSPMRRRPPRRAN